MSQLQSLRKQVLQLRQEANINRISVSQACEDDGHVRHPKRKENSFQTLPFLSLMKFCTEHQKSDVLVYGVSQSENPFKENKGCALL